MSDECVPEAVGVGIAPNQTGEVSSGPSEFDLGYYGWRVVLAACLRRDGGIRLAVRLHIFGFCEAAGRGIRLESRSHLQRLRNRRRHSGRVLPAAGPVDRPLRPSPHHSSLHDDVWVRHCFVVTVALRNVAVLPDLLRAGRGWERCGSSGLFAIDFHLVSATFGDGAGFCDGGSGLGRHDSAGRRANHHQPVWLACSVRVTRRHCIAARLAAQLALHPRTRADRARVRSGRCILE